MDRKKIRMTGVDKMRIVDKLFGSESRVGGLEEESNKTF